MGKRVFLTMHVLVISCMLAVASFFLTGCSKAKTSLKGQALLPFTAKGCHFKVLLPGTPDDQSSNNMMYGSSARRFICEDEECAFGVSEESFGGMAAAALKRNNPILIQNALDAGCKSGVEFVKGVETSRSSVVLGGGAYPGRDIQGTITKPAKGKFHYRFYLDPINGRLYSVGVVGYANRVDSAEAQKVLSSLQIW